MISICNYLEPENVNWELASFQSNSVEENWAHLQEMQVSLSTIYNSKAKIFSNQLIQLGEFERAKEFISQHFISIVEKGSQEDLEFFSKLYAFCYFPSYKNEEYDRAFVQWYQSRSPKMHDEKRDFAEEDFLKTHYAHTLIQNGWESESSVSLFEEFCQKYPDEPFY